MLKILKKKAIKIVQDNRVDAFIRGQIAPILEQPVFLKKKLIDDLISIRKEGGGALARTEPL